MANLILILGDQLSPTISSLADCDKSSDSIFMCEVSEEARYVKHHRKKIAFLFSAMRHFAKELEDEGYRVVYRKFEDSENKGSIEAEIRRQMADGNYEKLLVTHPGEYRVLENLSKLKSDYGISLDILEDDRFFCSTDEFSRWVKGRKQLRMEYFYRDMRRRFSILTEGGAPIGGSWNYDSENRKFPDDDVKTPQTAKFDTDKITEDVLKLVADKFPDHFGEIEPFDFAVTRADALKALNDFVRCRLETFGDYQDAMREGDPWMFHAHISFYLNCGLLNPRECVAAAVDAYERGEAPINAVEGFIRQIIGWREFIRGIYWMMMPGYEALNFFDSKRALPDFYWSGDTMMNCIKDCIHSTKNYAYAHHIQRLMVLGNFALLTGINPKEVSDWFLSVYADAYEWVELPNVIGMALFADGGKLASKPYASGGNYINKMSNYCKSCHYKVSKKSGEGACPFNYLYWDFLARNRTKLEGNPRIGMLYKTYDRMSEEKKAAIAKSSADFLKELD